MKYNKEKFKNCFCLKTYFKIDNLGEEILLISCIFILCALFPIIPIVYLIGSYLICWEYDNIKDLKD